MDLPAAYTAAGAHRSKAIAYARLLGASGELSNEITASCKQIKSHV